MNQRRTILGACEYSIATLNQLRKDLLDHGAKDAEKNWAIGGIVITLTSHLIRICDEVFQGVAREGNPNAMYDILEIKEKFDEFVFRMVDHE